MASMMNVFKAVIIVQLFYSFCITMMVHAIPVDVNSYNSAFGGLDSDLDLETVSNDIQNSITRQINIPVIELGALVYYSGNIILDLLLNFAFAVPEMITILVQGIGLIFGFEGSEIFADLQIFLSVIMVIMYFIGLMQLLTNIRSRSAVI